MFSIQIPHVWISMSCMIVSLCCFHQDPEQLFQACEQGDLEVVHKFLAAGIDVDIKDAVNTSLCGVWIVVYTQLPFLLE